MEAPFRSARLTFEELKDILGGEDVPDQFLCIVIRKRASSTGDALAGQCQSLIDVNQINHAKLMLREDNLTKKQRKEIITYLLCRACGTNWYIERVRKYWWPERTTGSLPGTPLSSLQDNALDGHETAPPHISLLPATPIRIKKLNYTSRNACEADIPPILDWETGLSDSDDILAPETSGNMSESLLASRMRLLRSDRDAGSTTRKDASPVMNRNPVQSRPNSPSPEAARSISGNDIGEITMLTPEKSRAAQRSASAPPQAHVKNALETRSVEPHGMSIAFHALAENPMAPNEAASGANPSVMANTVRIVAPKTRERNKLPVSAALSPALSDQPVRGRRRSPSFGPSLHNDGFHLGQGYEKAPWVIRGQVVDLLTKAIPGSLSCLYVAEVETGLPRRYVKIGITSDIKQRFASIKRAHGVTLCEDNVRKTPFSHTTQIQRLEALVHADLTFFQRDRDISKTEGKGTRATEYFEIGQSEAWKTVTWWMEIMRQAGMVPESQLRDDLADRIYQWNLDLDKNPDSGNGSAEENNWKHLNADHERRNRVWSNMEAKIMRTTAARASSPPSDCNFHSRPG